MSSLDFELALRLQDELNQEYANAESHEVREDSPEVEFFFFWDFTVIVRPFVNERKGMTM